MKLITNSNFKIEISRRFNISNLVLKIGGVFVSQFKGAINHNFIIYSKQLNKKFLITLLIYSTGSIVITNLPLLISNSYNNISIQTDINKQLFRKIIDICRYSIPSLRRRNINIHGSKLYQKFTLLPNFISCSFNNISLSFKSNEIIKKFEEKSIKTVINEIIEAFPDFIISLIDNRDYFTASKIYVSGKNNDCVKMSFTFFSQFGQVICSGIKSFSDVVIFQKIVKLFLI